MKRWAARVALAIAVAIAPLVVWAPPAAAQQQVVISFYFDLDGDGVKQGHETSRPPSSLHPNLAGWLVRVWFYKVDDDDRILAETWENVALNGSLTTLSRRLSPGRWVAVLGQVDQGDFDQAPDWGNGSTLTQTQPRDNQSIELTVTADGPNQSVRFGYGPVERLIGYLPGTPGPSFRVTSDEDYDQVSDPGEPSVPDGTELTLTRAHLRDGSAIRRTTSAGVVTFPLVTWWGAKILGPDHGTAAPPPPHWASSGYSEFGSSTVRHLVHEDVNDDCDTDPDDGGHGSCASWPLPHDRPALALLPARTPVAGTVFVDDNGNGVRDPGETAPDVPGLRLEFAPEGRYPEDVSPNPFTWEAESEVLTDGRFDLGRVPRGTYVLRTSRPSWRVTTGPVVVPTTGTVLGPLEVGISGTYATGRLYVDRDGDTSYTPGEETLGGVRLRSWESAGEATEVLGEMTTDAQGRFRILVDGDDPTIEIVDDLSDTYDHPYRFSLPTPTAGGDVVHDLAVFPRGRPGEAWPAQVRLDGDTLKLWWTPPEEAGATPVRGYLLRRWQLPDTEEVPTLLGEQCVTAASTYATWTVDPTATDQVVTVQAVNDAGAGPFTSFDDADSGRTDGPTPATVGCGTLLGNGPVDPDPEPEPEALPASPTGVAVTRAHRAVDVSWTPGAVDDDHDAATQYLVRGKQGNGAWRTLATVDGGTTSTRLTGLAPRTTYTFVVVARNDAGESVPSAGRTVTVQAKPAKPRAVKVTPKRRALVVRWKPGKLTATHGTTTGYLVQRKAGKAWTTVATKPGKARRHKVTKLAPGKVVRLRVVAVSAVGRSPSAVVRGKPRR